MSRSSRKLSPNGRQIQFRTICSVPSTVSIKLSLLQLWCFFVFASSVVCSLSNIINRHCRPLSGGYPRRNGMLPTAAFAGPVRIKTRTRRKIKKILPQKWVTIGESRPTKTQTNTGAKNAHTAQRARTAWRRGKWVFAFAFSPAFCFALFTTANMTCRSGM